MTTAALVLAATASADTAVNCTRNPAALQQALAEASPGDTLRIEGRCVGTYTIDKSVTLDGKTNAVIDGNGQGPVLRIVAGVNVLLDRIVVTGGASVAPAAVGGIANAGHLQLRRSQVAGNSAVGQVRATGGIESGPVATASLSLDRTDVVDNHASAATSGSAIVVGGVRNDGPVAVTRSEIRGNRALATTGGLNRVFGGIAFGLGFGFVDHTVIRDNIARSEHTGVTGGAFPPAGATGGFVHLPSNDELVIDNSRIEGNRAFAISAVSSIAAGGAALAGTGTSTRLTTFRRTDVVANVAEGGTRATGGLANNNAAALLERSTISANAAAATEGTGAAIGGIDTGFLGAASTTLTRNSVSDNVAQAGDAVGGLYQVAGTGTYEMDRTDVIRNLPVNCNFACGP